MYILITPDVVITTESMWEQRLGIIQRSYVHKGILLWNSIDSCIKDYYSISTFKKKIKSYLLDNS